MPGELLIGHFAFFPLAGEYTRTRVLVNACSRSRTCIRRAPTNAAVSSFTPRSTTAIIFNNSRVDTEIAVAKTGPIDARSHREFPERKVTSLHNQSGRATTESRFYSNHVWLTTASIVFHSSAVSCIFRAAIFSSRCASDDVPGIGSITGDRCSSHASPS